MTSWEDLKYVLAMARHGNATAEGKALRVNATTVTRRVTAIEDALQTALFERTPRGTRLTPAGERAVVTAERIEREVLELDARVVGLDAELSGGLRVTSMDVLFDLWQPDLRAFREQHPHVSLALSSSAAPADLMRREADVALRVTVMPPERLVGRRFVEVFYAIYGSRELVNEQCADGLAAYANYPWIGWDEPFAEPTDRVIERLAKGATVAMRLNSMNRLLRTLEAGEGISVMPCFVGDRSPYLQRIGPYFEGETYLWALTHEQLRRTGRVRAFMEYIAGVIERDALLFRGEQPRMEAASVQP
ncbi:MAG: LysR family transcriptional regulator [Myxococcota bacterium]